MYFYKQYCYVKFYNFAVHNFFIFFSSIAGVEESSGEEYVVWWYGRYAHFPHAGRAT